MGTDEHIGLGYLGALCRAALTRLSACYGGTAMIVLVSRRPPVARLRLFLFFLAVASLAPWVAIADTWVDIDAVGAQPVPRYAHTAVAVNGKAYIFGGASAEPVRCPVANDIWMYDQLLCEWERGSSAGQTPVALSQPAAITLDGDIYIIGGRQESSRALQVFVYDPAEKYWRASVLPRTQPPPTSFHTATLVGDVAYMIGGYDDAEGRHAGDVWACHLRAGAIWEKRTPMPPGTERWGHTTVSVGNKQFVFGGSTPTGRLNELWCYDVDTDSWTQIETSGGPPPVRANHSVAYADGRMWIFGGHTGHALLSDTWELDLTTFTWIRKTDGTPQHAAAATVLDDGSTGGPITVLVTYGSDGPGETSFAETSWKYYPDVNEVPARLGTRIEPSAAAVEGCEVTPSSSANLALGATIPLVATAANGWEFSHWSGDASGAVPTTSLTIAKHCSSAVAHFRKATLTLAGGTRSDIACPCDVASGAKMLVLPFTLTANEESDWQVHAVQFESSFSGGLQHEDILEAWITVRGRELGPQTYISPDDDLLFAINETVLQGQTLALELSCVFAERLRHDSFTGMYEVQTRVDLVSANPTPDGEGSMLPPLPASVIAKMPFGRAVNLQTSAVYPSLTAALSAPETLPGHTTEVCPGTHVANLVIDKPRLTIQSKNGAAETILKAADAGSPVADLAVPDITLQGLMIASSTTRDGGPSIGIDVRSSGTELVDCVVTGTEVGVRIGDGVGCTISGCRIANAETGLHAQTTERVSIADTTFSANGTGLRLVDSPDVLLSGLLIADSDTWGIHASGHDLRLGFDGEKVADQTTEIRTCGMADASTGGGILCEDGDLYVANATVTGCGGPGILVTGNIVATAIVCTNNRGPGMQSIGGTVRVERTAGGRGWDDPLEWHSEISGNLGYGIAVTRPGEGARNDSEETGLCLVGPLIVADNAAAGVYSEAGATVNTEDDPELRTSRCRISANGKGTEAWLVTAVDAPWAQVEPKMACRLGGVVVASGNASLIHADTSANRGGGIVCSGDITVRAIRSHGNEGSGLVTFGGIIRFEYVSDRLPKTNEVTDNQGYGIAANIELPDDPLDEDGSLGVDVRGRLSVERNAAAGIVSNGWVSLNWENSTHDVFSETNVESNGLGIDAWVFPTPEAPITEVDCQAECILGGVVSTAGEVRADELTARTNRGGGVLAMEDIRVRDITSRENFGPGLQSMAGQVVIEARGDGRDSNEIRGNLGYGIVAHYRVEDEYSESDPGVTVETDVTVKDNAAGGIWSFGDITINEVGGLTGSDDVSPVSNNGLGTEAWVIEDIVSGPTKVNPQTGCIRAGLFSSAGNITVRGIEASGNGGPGVLAWGDITLHSPTVNGNVGPGIQSFTGHVVIGLLSCFSGSAAEVSANKGYGILAGDPFDSAPLSPGSDEEHPGVFIECPVEVDDNAGSGICAEGDVTVNMRGGHTVGTRRSLIEDSGRLPTCWIVEEPDELLEEVPKADCILAGIYSAHGTVWARNVEVYENYRHGIEADAVDVWQADFDDNMGYGIVCRSSAPQLRSVLLQYNGAGGVWIGGDSQTRTSAPRRTGAYLADIDGCVFNDNDGPDILVEDDPLTLTITRSAFLHWGPLAINNVGIATVVARGNWWDLPEGPAGRVSGNVDTTDWLADALGPVVIADGGRSAQPGTDATLHFAVTCIGSASGDYVYSAEDSAGWNPVLSSSESYLGVYSLKGEAVTLTVPEDLSDDVASSLTFTVTPAGRVGHAASTTVDVIARSVVVNEVHPHEGWIELLNTSTTALPLAGWRLTADEGGVDYTIPATADNWDGILEPNAVLVTHFGASGHPDTVAEDLYPAVRAAPSTSGDTVSFLTPAGFVVDMVLYGESGPTPAAAHWYGPATAAPLEHQSLGRDQTGTDTDAAADWDAAAGPDAQLPSPGWANTPSIPITFSAGWNLFSSPVGSHQTVADLLATGGGTRGSVHAAMFVWEQKRYRVLTETSALIPLAGCWAFVCGEAPVQCLLHGPPPTTDPVVIDPGWNLLGPSTDGPVPVAEFLADTVWAWEDGRYRQIHTRNARDGNELRCTQAYWFYSNSDQQQQLQFVGE